MRVPIEKSFLFALNPGNPLFVPVRDRSLPPEEQLHIPSLSPEPVGLPNFRLQPPLRFRWQLIHEMPLPFLFENPSPLQFSSPYRLFPTSLFQV